MTLVDEQGTPLVGVGIVVVSEDGTVQDVNSDDEGRVDMIFTPENPKEV